MMSRSKVDPQPDSEEIVNWPGWWYGPDGEAEIFNGPLEVPEGWHDHPRKHLSEGELSVIVGLEEALVARDEQALEQAERDKQKLEEAADDDGDATPSTDNDELDLTNQDVVEETLLPVDDLSAEEIKARLQGREVAFNASWSKQRLYDLLADNIKKA